MNTYFIVIFVDRKLPQSVMKQPLHLIIDSAIPFLEGIFEPWARVTRLPGRDIGPGTAADADALIIRTRTRCDERLLDAAPRLRLIATATIGFDHIDTEACRRRGIRVATAAGCNARGVLQWVAGVLVHLSRTQGWRPGERTLGIVGVGHVGSLVRQYAAAWGFSVVCCDPPRQARREPGTEGFMSVGEVARQSDLITFHTPLDATTRHLCDDRLLQQLPGNAAVINASRGEVVDGTALLRSGRTFALDVWEHEPHIDPALLAAAEVATPHIAGYSLQGKANASALAVRAVAETFGLPLDTWYPGGIAPSRPQPVGWEALCATIGSRFDCRAETARLKAAPEAFETLRDQYRYREEYF